MKKTLVAVLLFAMLLSCAACGTKTTETPSTTPSTPAATTPADTTPVTTPATTPEPAPATSNDTFPSRYIELVNCWSAGGFNDMSARIIASVASNYLGQPMVVVSKTGGSGAVGAQYVCEDGPSCYRVLWGMSTQAINGPLTIQDYPFKFEDWDYVCSLCATERVLVVKKGAWSGMQEVLDFSKANPGKFLYGSSGTGAAGHLAAEQVAAAAGVEWTHIPYDGTAPALAALVGGHVDMVCAQPSEVLELYNAGEVDVILCTTEMDLFPGAPTLESFGLGSWYARTLYPIGVPAGTSKEDMKVLEDVMKQVSEDPTFLKMMGNIGAEVIFMTGEETKAAYEATYENMKAITESLNLLG